MKMAQLVLQTGWSSREVARYSGYNQSTIVRWVEKARSRNLRTIPTLSSRPWHHPKALSREIVGRILNLRGERQQCAEILHHRLRQEGVVVSLSSVKRVLKRHGCSKFSRWKKWHQYPPRPLPEKPGSLVEIDTVWDGNPNNRLYLYTGLDVCSRWGFAKPVTCANTHESWRFLLQNRPDLPFLVQTLQSDHGAEFSKWFTKQCLAAGIQHRHSRVRRPTDNGHLERFNRTIQTECLARVPRTLKSWLKAIPDYLHYYNHERPHMGLKMKTPNQVMQRY